MSRQQRSTLTVRILVALPLLFVPAIALSPLSWASAIALAAAATLLGGMWTVAVAAVLLRDLPRSDFQPVGTSTAIVYGATLALVLGTTTLVATLWAHGSMAGWALLTILVVVRPGVEETWHRIITRSAGTIAGGLVAAALAAIAPVPWLLLTIGFVALAAAILLKLEKASYALHAFALTTAIVLVNSRGAGVAVIDVERVAFTVIGALIAAIAAAAVQFTLLRRAATRRNRTRHL